MPTPATAAWPLPKSEDEFEDIVLDALRIVWNDPHATRHGRRGQAQNGVDVIGKDLQNAGRVVGAQSKNVHALTLKEIIAIIAEAETYQPALAELLVVISGPRDGRIQQAVHEISQARSNEGKFSVRQLFWDDLTGLLSGRLDLVSKPCRHT